MVKRIAASLLCFVLILVGIALLGHITRPVGDDVAIAGIEAFHQLPEYSVAVIDSGSSHARRHVNVHAMYNNYGIGASN